MNRTVGPPICSNCQEHLQLGWTAPCGHAFCVSCFNCDSGVLRCSIDLQSYETRGLIKDQSLCKALQAGNIKAAYELVNTEGVRCRYEASCKHRETCPYSHPEEDLFKSMAPVFPEADLSHSARSDLESDVLNEYLVIEGVTETSSSDQPYLQGIVQQVSEKADIAYQWLKSL